jgi:fumarylacetoacetase
VTGFGLDHLPLGVFALPGEGPRVGVRYEDGVLDLAAAGLGDVFRASTLNAFLAQGRPAWELTRERARSLLERGDAELLPIGGVHLRLPFAVADYVDFNSSLEHATNMGRIFRPDEEPLPPNWRWLPVGYHGRAGTVVVSGTPVPRPRGQAKEPDAAEPVYGPSRRLDVELELAAVVGVGSERGRPVPPYAFADHVFGIVLLNDWSARDVQGWESRPLGPFLGKSFATSIGAWVTPLAALDPYRVSGPPQEPPPLAHLRSDEPWALDLDLELELNGAVISRTNARGLYWSLPQQLAHATSNGASLATGDLMATGTISGFEPGRRGSLMELSWNGAEPLELPDGSRRTFLEDGDEVVLRGRTPDGRVELADVRGRIEPSARAARAHADA